MLDGLHSSIFISISLVIQLVYLQFHSVDGNLDDGECEVARSANTIVIFFMCICICICTCICAFTNQVW